MNQDIVRLLEANARELNNLGTKVAQLQADNEELLAKVAHYEKRETCAKLASEMVARGISSESVEDVTKNLMGFPAEKIAQYQAAIELQGPQNFYDNYRLSSEEAVERPLYEGGAAKMSAQALDAFVNGG